MRTRRPGFIRVQWTDFALENRTVCVGRYVHRAGGASGPLRGTSVQAKVAG